MLHTTTLYDLQTHVLDLMLDALEQQLNFMEGKSVSITRKSDGIISVHDYDSNQLMEQYRYFEEVTWETVERSIREWLEEVE